MLRSGILLAAISGLLLGSSLAEGSETEKIASQLVQKVGPGADLADYVSEAKLWLTEIKGNLFKKKLAQTLEELISLEPAVASCELDSVLEARRIYADYEDTEIRLPIYRAIRAQFNECRQALIQETEGSDRQKIVLDMIERSRRGAI